MSSGQVQAGLIGRVHTGDALEVLYPALEDKSVSLVSQDIPYNLTDSYQEIVVRSKKPRAEWKKTRESKERGFSVGVGAYDLKPFAIEEHMAQWRRLLKPGGMVVVWHGERQLERIHGFAEREFDLAQLQVLMWHVTNPAPVIRQARLPSAVQFSTLIRTKGPSNRLLQRWKGQGPANHNAWAGPGFPDEINAFEPQFEVDNAWTGPGVFHPDERRKVLDPETGLLVGLKGQKPQWLGMRIVEYFGEEGGLCLDGTAGTGALLVAAWKMGMQVVGAELAGHWAQDANLWLSDVAASDLLARTRRLAAASVQPLRTQARTKVAPPIGTP